MMARKRAKGLTERQTRILEVLERFQSQNGYPPSIREICDKANISSTSVVNYYLNQREGSGYIQRDGRVSCGIRVYEAAVGDHRHGRGLGETVSASHAPGGGVAVADPGV